MRMSISGVTIASVLFVIPSIATAGTIRTPPIIMSQAQQDDVACAVANTGTKAVGPFTITIYASNGAVATALTGSSLPPKASTAALASTLALVGLTAWCEVTGQGISKKKTPATICRIPDGGATTCQAAASSP